MLYLEAVFYYEFSYCFPQIANTLHALEISLFYEIADLLGF